MSNADRPAPRNPFAESDDYKCGYLDGMKLGMRISWADAYGPRKDTRMLITRTINRFARMMKIKPEEIVNG